MKKNKQPKQRIVYIVIIKQELQKYSRTDKEERQLVFSILAVIGQRLDQCACLVTGVVVRSKFARPLD